jgi:polyphosphate kinase 2 (PPK2 family)
MVNSGILLIKYWFDVSTEEQERRFRARIKDQRKKLMTNTQPNRQPIDNTHARAP